MELKNLQYQWDKFARIDPMWSILTDPQNRRGRWDKAKFFKSGVADINELMNTIAAKEYKIGNENILDFGCGMGRLTQPFLDYFQYCYGIDISEEMIQLAREHNQHGDRCRYQVNQSDTLSWFKDDYFDLICCVLVLQHVERKFAESYLREFIRVMKPGGLLVFQLPSSKSPNYDSYIPKTAFLLKVRNRIQHALKKHFGVREEILYKWYLSDIPAVMEMNCIERSEVERHIKLDGGTVLETERYDAAGPAFISYRYWVTKRF